MYIIALLFSGDCSHHSDCNYMASLTLYILPVMGGFTLRKFAYAGNECPLQGANVLKHLGSPYQAKGFPLGYAFRHALYSHCWHRNLFLNPNSKTSFCGKYQKTTAILTNLMCDWNFKLLTSRLLESWILIWII